MDQSLGFPKYFSLFTSRVLQTAVWTFAELGIADYLADSDGPQTADEIAQKQGWDSDYLYRLLRTVADLDIVYEIKSNQTREPEKTNRFQLTESGSLLLSDHPSKSRYFILWESNPIVKLAELHLPELIREGPKKANGFERVTNNTPFFDYMQRKENQYISHIFNEAMTSVSIETTHDIVNRIDLSRFDVVVDIGGGFGFLLACMLEKYPAIKRGICFDLPNVIQAIELNNEFEKRKIPKNRYQYMAGDMFFAETIPQADAYIMKNIIHDWDDDQSIDILNAIRTAARGKKITIFIIGLVILPENEQNKSINQTTHIFDIHMMILSTSKQRTQSQYEYLFEHSGFRLEHLYRTNSMYSIIEAVAN